ncbi:hypothetical protein [Roseococcus thiosulfatophilus]|uniref:hypothetical protein n=1 Tax=Roseococcus thiosulfatophilus TaxID=35813 RepID=UPI001A8F8778|nr:hypothetical protein [Roseococcus thiosulfatophilus]
MTISAAVAGDALTVVATKLLENNILEPEGFAVLLRVSSELKRAKGAVSWVTEVDRGQPVRFVKHRDRSGITITPTIVAKRIRVDQAEGTTPPFTSLDLALEIDDDQGNPVSRWHLDVANARNGGVQSGPLVHLQYGGHHHDAGHLDHPLKTPRWCHPPMELALLSEVVAANFFESQWIEMRDDPGWCGAITVFQKLCYHHYAERLIQSLSKSATTTLNTMWGNTWRDA